jgi:hypothetical protein
VIPYKIMSQTPGQYICQMCKVEDLDDPILPLPDRTSEDYSFYNSVCFSCALKCNFTIRQLVKHLDKVMKEADITCSEWTD